jgi:hypothetical protein
VHGTESPHAHGTEPSSSLRVFLYSVLYLSCRPTPSISIGSLHHQQCLPATAAHGGEQETDRELYIARPPWINVSMARGPQAAASRRCQEGPWRGRRTCPRCYPTTCSRTSSAASRRAGSPRRGAPARRGAP